MKQLHTTLPATIRGLTLVEIMIALVLSLLLSAGAIQVYLSNKISYQTAEALSRIQENGRFAIQFLTKEIRMAGFIGCAVASTGNSVNSTPDSWVYNFNDSVIGFELKKGSTLPSKISSSAITGTDAIAISRGGDDTYFYVKSHDANNATIHLTANYNIKKGSHNIKKGEILMIVDCQGKQAGIFQVTGDKTNPINHATGTATPGNCTSNLYGNFDCSDHRTKATKGDYNDKSKLLRMKNSIFYLADGRKNSQKEAIPALYRSVMNASGGNIKVVEEELIEGVENLQILYGIDTDGTADGIANLYVTAGSVGDWSKVASVRLFLLVRSIEPTSGGVKPYTFMGTSYSDNYIRRQFTATVQIRNRGLDL